MSEDDLTEFTAEIADQVNSFVIAVTEVARGEEPAQAVSMLLLEMSQLLLAGGRLGTGPFDPVVVPVGWALLAGIAWIGVPGAVVAALAAPAPTPQAPARPVVANGSAEDTTGERVEPDTPEVTEQD